MSNKRLLKDFSFGFELEGTYDNYEINTSRLKHKFDSMLGGEGSMHGDGSLRAEGGYSTFEYASPVIQFTPVNIQKVIKFLDSLPSMFVKINRTCGFHTHISFKGITKKDAVWAMASMASDGSYEEFLKLGRTNLYRAPYAKPTFLHKAHEYAKNGQYRRMVEVIVDNEKYRSIRIHPQGTIEWRGPRTFLNTIKHSKNVAFFKKLSKFIMKINESLDKDYTSTISKAEFMSYANSRLNSLYFKEENVSHKSERLSEALMRRPNTINHLPAESFEALRQASVTFSTSTLLNTMRINNVKLKSENAINYMSSMAHLQSFIDLIDIDTFKENMAMFGQRNMLTPTFEHLMRNPGVNDEVLKFMIDCVTKKFGQSNIKTFTYNAMLEMIKYNPNIFKVAINKNLYELFGYEKAQTLIHRLIECMKYSFIHSDIYKLLLDSPNADLTKNTLSLTSFNIQYNNILNESIASMTI